MKKASEYRQHADECRRLAGQMDTAEHRDQLLWMAERWEDLASDRLAMVWRHPELASEDELTEARRWAARRSS